MGASWHGHGRLLHRRPPRAATTGTRCRTAVDNRTQQARAGRLASGDNRRGATVVGVSSVGGRAANGERYGASWLLTAFGEVTEQTRYFGPLLSHRSNKPSVLSHLLAQMTREVVCFRGSVRQAPADRPKTAVLLTGPRQTGLKPRFCSHRPAETHTSPVKHGSSPTRYPARAACPGSPA